MNYYISKKYEKNLQQTIFIITTASGQQVSRTAQEVSFDKLPLPDLEPEGIYDIGYTCGTETVVEEQKMLNQASVIYQ